MTSETSGSASNDGTYPLGSLRQLYRFTGLIGLAGSLVSLIWRGPRMSLAFAAGALCSLGNLWLFDRLSRGLVPGPRQTKPWQAGAYIARYLLLVGVGYAIVKLLDVSALALFLGLLASAAAAVASVLTELLLNAFGTRKSH